MTQILSAILAGLITLSGSIGVLPLDDAYKVILSVAVSVGIAAIGAYLGKPAATAVRMVRRALRGGKAP